MTAAGQPARAVHACPVHRLKRLFLIELSAYVTQICAFRTDFVLTVRQQDGIAIMSAARLQSVSMTTARAAGKIPRTM